MRITLVNATLRIDDHWTRAAGIALAAAAALLLGAVFTRRAHRAALAIAAAGLSIAAGAAGTAYVDAGPEALSARHLFRRTAIPWNEVSRVDSRQDYVRIEGAGGAVIHIDASRLGPQQRAVLERTLSRHVKEAPAPAPDPAPAPSAR